MSSFIYIFLSHSANEVPVCSTEVWIALISSSFGGLDETAAMLGVLDAE